MKERIATTGNFREAFQHNRRCLPGDDILWLRQLRAEALDQFLRLGLPTRKQESWKYTNVTSLAERRLEPISRPAKAAATILDRSVFSGEKTHRITFIDGHFSVGLSILDALPTGVTVTRFFNMVADKDEGEKMKCYLSGETSGTTIAFKALNTAFMTDGAYIHIDADVKVQQPIHLLFVSTGINDTMVNVRNLIFAEQGSEAAIIETYSSLDSGYYLTNVVTNIIANENAVVEHYKIAREGRQAVHIADTDIQQGRNSRYTSHNVALEGRLVRNNVHAVLAAENSQCTLNGLYITQGNQHVDNTLNVEHRASHTNSRQWYKGVLDDTSRGAYSSRVVVQPGAHKSDAEQTNNNLLLSNTAEADSRPQLEIYDDDVKCSHGSTVGELDKDALFYFRARGLDETVARSMLVNAFAADVLVLMKLTSVQNYLKEIITERLVKHQPQGEPL